MTSYHTPVTDTIYICAQCGQRITIGHICPKDTQTRKAGEFVRLDPRHFLIEPLGLENNEVDVWIKCACGEVVRIFQVDAEKTCTCGRAYRVDILVKQP